MAQADRLVSFTKKLTETNKPQALGSSASVKSVLVKAKATNATTVRIGPSTVSATSYPLEPGEAISFDVLDPSQVFVFGNENDEVFVLGLEV